MPFEKKNTVGEKAMKIIIAIYENSLTGIKFDWFVAQIRVIWLKYWTLDLQIVFFR